MTFEGHFDTCESKAVCMKIAPTVFDVRDDSFLYILDESPELARKAAKGCPTKSITMVGN